jgi:hypothetical protein
VDEVTPAAGVPTVEHRKPCEPRGSRTVLGAPGGEIPPGDSPGCEPFRFVPPSRAGSPATVFMQPIRDFVIYPDLVLPDDATSNRSNLLARFWPVACKGAGMTGRSRKMSLDFTFAALQDRAAAGSWEISWTTCTRMRRVPARRSQP